MRALVTGAAGFVGGWLVRALLAEGVEVHGTRLATDESTTTDDVQWHLGDLRDPAAIGTALAHARPDVVYHLAAVSSVGDAAAAPVAATESNVLLTVRLLDEIRRRRAETRDDPVVLVVGSSEQYGAHSADEQPLAEAAEQRPVTLYAATKCAQEAFARQAARRDGLRVVCTRSFNHSGAGQSDRFVLPALVRRALALRAQGGGTLRTGNLTPVRDLSHVADVVDAYILLAAHGVPGEVYNVCTGMGYSVRRLGEAVLSRLGVAGELEEDPALVRAVDVPILVGDGARLRDATDWTPRRTLDDCIDDLVHAATL